MTQKGSGAFFSDRRAELNGREMEKPGEPADENRRVHLRQPFPSDAAAIHALLRPYVSRRLLLQRSGGGIIGQNPHGFVAEIDVPDATRQRIGFAAVEIYSPKLAELQCLAVHHEHQNTGVGKKLVAACLQRARELNVMEVLAISSSEDFLRSCGFDYSLPDQKKALFCQLRPRQ